MLLMPDAAAASCGAMLPVATDVSGVSTFGAAARRAVRRRAAAVALADRSAGARLRGIILAGL